MNAPTTDPTRATHDQDAAPPAAVEQGPRAALTPAPAPEFGGRKDGLDPTRYGDWEKDGRCIDF